MLSAPRRFCTVVKFSLSTIDIAKQLEMFCIFLNSDDRTYKVSNVDVIGNAEKAVHRGDPSGKSALFGRSRHQDKRHDHMIISFNFSHACSVK